MAFFTFGYEGLTVEAFIERLLAADVEIVLDVRELPLSRKPGFSKSTFARFLGDAGISYEHLPVLGCPRPIRNRYKIDGDWSQYTLAFSAYLAGQSKAIREQAERVKKISACLVCFECDFKKCHRSLVAREMVRAGAPEVIHLSIRRAIPDVVPLLDVLGDI